MAKTKSKKRREQNPRKKQTLQLLTPCRMSLPINKLIPNRDLVKQRFENIKRNLLYTSRLVFKDFITPLFPKTPIVDPDKPSKSRVHHPEIKSQIWEENDQEI